MLKPIIYRGGGKAFLSDAPYFLPRPLVDDFDCFQERRRFVEFQLLARFEAESLADFQWDCNLAFACKGRFHYQLSKNKK